MKLFIFVISCLFSFEIYSQNVETYWFGIVDSSKIPTVTQDGSYVKLDFNDKAINKIFSQYDIISFNRSFPTSTTPLLQTIFEMEIFDYNLITEMNQKASHIFINIEEMPEVQLLYIPTDFGTNGGELQEQEELNYIKAPQAWDLSTGNLDVVLGISEGVNINHEDLIGQSALDTGVSGSSGNYHGTLVALFAAARTDNNVGIASIGFDSFILSRPGGVNAVIQLAQKGVKAINMSWGFCGASANTIQIYQNAMDEAYSHGAVLVAAAGNGLHSCSTLGTEAYHYPAANDHVIAVTAVGHLYELGDPDPSHNNQKDKFELTGNYFSVTTNNDRVDLAAPGWYVLSQVDGQATGTYGYTSGTSFAAPIVTGTIGLMFDLNYCLTQEEVETILKLTSRKIDNLAVNQIYSGKIGSGVLDAYEAVKMAKDMAEEYGTVQVKDRILYRSWTYKLETAPFEIKMMNNNISQASKLEFKARNNIEILSGDYYPNIEGYIDLSIDESLSLDCPSPSSSRLSDSSNQPDNEKEIDFKVFPTLVVDNITVIKKDTDLNELIYIKVFDFFGTEVYSSDKIELKEITVNLKNLYEGIHILKIYNSKNEVLGTFKIVKQ